MKNLLNEIAKSEEKGYLLYSLKLCNEMILRDSDIWPILTKKGTILTQLRRYEEAEKALITALNKCPKEKAYMVLREQGHLEKERGKSDKAIKYFLKVLSIKEQDISTLNYLGNVYFEVGKLDDAEKVFLRAIKCNDGDKSESYFNLGGVYLSMDRIENARECYQKVIDIDHEYKLAIVRLKDINETYKKCSSKRGSTHT